MLLTLGLTKPASVTLPREAPANPAGASWLKRASGGCLLWGVRAVLQFDPTTIGAPTGRETHQRPFLSRRRASCAASTAQAWFWPRLDYYVRLFRPPRTRARARVTSETFPTRLEKPRSRIVPT